MSDNDFITREELEALADPCECQRCGALLEDVGPLCILCECEDRNEAPEDLPEGWIDLDELGPVGPF